MDKFDKLLEQLQNLKIQQNSSWDECLPEDIWNDHFKGNFIEKAKGLLVDQRRWYEISTEVIEIYGRLLGISSVTNLYSESMDTEDCGVEVCFTEFKAVESVSYIKKT